MKRKMDKLIDKEKAMEQFEQLEKQRFEEVNKIKQIEFQENKKYCDENDAAFYFSVVFNTKTERDKWLKEHNIVLEEDFFVKAEDFNI